MAALTGPQESVWEQCAEYERRNYALCRGRTKIGWEVPDGQGTMFVWAPIPKNYQSSEKFVIDLMEKAGFSANIITRIKRDNYISLDTIEKICKTLDCGVDDILEFTTEIEQ